MKDEQFKKICIEKAYQAKKSHRISFSHYLYLIDYFEAKDDSISAIPKDGLKFADLFDTSTKEKAERALKHLKSRNEALNELGLKIKLNFGALKRQAESWTKEYLKELEKEFAAYDQDEKKNQERECLKEDWKDLSRIHAIDIRNYDSFFRVSAFYFILSKRYNALTVSSKRLQERIDEFNILDEHKNILRDKHNQLIGYWSAMTGINFNESLKEFHAKRTESSTKTKRMKRKIKEEYVCKAYLIMIQGKSTKERELLASLSEYKIARQIKEEIISDLNKKKH